MIHIDIATTSTQCVSKDIRVINCYYCYSTNENSFHIDNNIVYYANHVILICSLLQSVFIKTVNAVLTTNTRSAILLKESVFLLWQNEYHTLTHALTPESKPVCSHQLLFCIKNEREWKRESPSGGVKTPTEMEPTKAFYKTVNARRICVRISFIAFRLGVAVEEVKWRRRKGGGSGRQSNLFSRARSLGVCLALFRLFTTTKSNL